jgi:hypothetical protein
MGLPSLTCGRRPARRHVSATRSSTPNLPWLGTLGAQSGDSRGSRRYLDHPELPVPQSAPGVNRTPDHRSPVGTRVFAPIANVRWDEMGGVWAQSGHSRFRTRATSSCSMLRAYPRSSSVSYAGRRAVDAIRSGMPRAPLMISPTQVDEGSLVGAPPDGRAPIHRLRAPTLYEPNFRRHGRHSVR